MSNPEDNLDLLAQAIDYEGQDFEYDASRERAALKKVYRD